MEANMDKKWPQRDLNPQPPDLESDALPLRHEVLEYNAYSMFLSYAEENIPYFLLSAYAMYADEHHNA